MSKIHVSSSFELCGDLLYRQSPQCEGLYSESRPFFQGYTSPYTKRFFGLALRKNSPLTLKGGEAHGFCKGDQLTVYKSRSEDHQKSPIATVEITKVRSDTSYLKITSGSTLSIEDCSQAAAALSKAAMQELEVYVDQESTLHQRIKSLELCRMSDASTDAHVAISGPDPQSPKKQLCIDVVDKDLLELKDVKSALKPRFIDDTEEDLAHLMKGLSHYYRHLKRTSDSLKDSIDKISISFFEVEDTGGNHPRVDKVKGAKNLCQNNVIDIDVTANPDALYGFEITNDTDHIGDLYPVLFYFDNTDFTICE